MKKKNKIVWIIIVFIFIFFLVKEKGEEEYGDLTEEGQQCIQSGGRITTGLCCENTEDFPNMCIIGACGCAPHFSHYVKICSCPDGCWDGTKCITGERTDIERGGTWVA